MSFDPAEEVKCSWYDGDQRKYCDMWNKDVKDGKALDELSIIRDFDKKLDRAINMSVGLTILLVVILVIVNIYSDKNIELSILFSVSWIVCIGLLYYPIDRKRDFVRDDWYKRFYKYRLG